MYTAQEDRAGALMSTLRSKAAEEAASNLVGE